MGLLAGSTVMLLTVLWGSCVIVGKCDLSEDSTSIDSQDTKAFSLFGQFLSQLFSAVCGFRSMAEVLFFLFLGKILTGSTSQIPRVLIKCTDLNNCDVKINNFSAIVAEQSQELFRNRRIIR